MTDKELNSIRHKVNNSSQGNWWINYDYSHLTIMGENNKSIAEMNTDNDNIQADAILLADAKKNIEKLLNYIDELKAQNDSKDRTINTATEQLRELIQHLKGEI